jgi:glycosyltransferase involved in cell wall biosynthesis
MKEMAASYNGPHKVILNRNEKNLGIGGDINRIMEIAQGELIIGVAGDDISLPERTKKHTKLGRHLIEQQCQFILYLTYKIIQK